VLFSISSGGAAIGLSSLSTYTYLKAQGFPLQDFSWIPIASFSFCLFIASWGVLTLPFLVIAELMPEKIRGLGSSFCMGLLWIFGFLTIKYLPLMTKTFEMHGCFAIFACCSFVGCLFSVFVLPETKGKSYEQISKMLGG
ncbi:Facilitated trehalose transporter Tret1, partial [Pseudolycoriella hygida]